MTIEKIAPQKILLYTAFELFSFSLRMFAPLPKMYFKIAQTNCIAYVIENTFEILLSPKIIAKTNQDAIGTIENINNPAPILKSLFIFPLIYNFVLFYHIKFKLYTINLNLVKTYQIFNQKH